MYSSSTSAAQPDDEYILSCRGCLAKVSKGHCYFFTWPEIKELFAECTNITIPDGDQGLPEQICSECYHKCEGWHSFKKMCQEINEHLQTKITKRSEEEPVEQMLDVAEEENIKCEDSREDNIQVDNELEETKEDDSINCTDENKSPNIDKNEKKNKKIICPICKKGYKKQRWLHTHFVKHTEERPYYCSNCKWDSQYKADVLRHITDEHGHEDGVLAKTKKNSIFRYSEPWLHFTAAEDSKKKKVVHKCRICKKKYSYKNSLKKHMAMHTEIGEDDEEESD